MRILVSDAVNGGGIVERLFWDFDGKTITLPQVRKITLLRVCGVASEEVFRGEVDNYRSMFNIADIISAVILPLVYNSPSIATQNEFCCRYPRLWIFQQFRQSCLPSFR